MKEVSKIIKYKDQEYKLVFNLNVMETIQEEYKTLDNWSKLTDGSGADGEPNIKALKFGLTAMLNEGIEIENETRAEKRDLLTDKQVGRIISEMGLDNLTADMNNVVIDSVKSDESKNG